MWAGNGFIPVTWEYGCHLSFGKGVFLNVGCLVLDGAEIKFGNRIAEGTKIYVSHY